MLKKNPRPDRQDDLFRPRLENIIDPRHELVKLALMIDWDGLEADLSGFYCADNGRPAGSIRLMTGLCFLKVFPAFLRRDFLSASLSRGAAFFEHFPGANW